MIQPTLSLEDGVDALIKGPQYALAQAEKEAALLPLVQALCERMSAGCPAYGRYLEKLGGPISAWRSVADAPPLPVTMFKKFDLRSVPESEIVRELNSSSTTGQRPSRIFVDKTTAFRQGRALASVLKEHVGGHRRPYLVLDCEEAVAAGDQLTARGAAIRGIGNFASSTAFALRKRPDGDLEPDWDAIERFASTAREKGDALLFGFTFMVWTRFVTLAERRGGRLGLGSARLLHSGGWKKLTAEAVSKGEFNRRAAGVIGCAEQNILDFYGMVEQVGSVFVDCSAANKHAPAFADVIIRDPATFRPVAPGGEGVIEVLSVLPTSYPGVALLTEDKGALMGVDDCPCGRRGSYFRFTSRVERTEVRGCGDTFAQGREQTGGSR